MEHEVNENCKDHINRIDKRLEEGDTKLDDHSNKITRLDANVSNVTKSLDGLSKALWGVSASIVAGLFAFFIWYVQTK